MTFLTIEEVAEVLKVKEADVVALIESGKMRAIRIGEHIRIPKEELGRLATTCAAGRNQQADFADEEAPAGTRLVATRTGRAHFRVAGSVATGVDLWPGKMRYPIKLPAEFMRALLAHFAGQEVPVGGKFDDPTPGSLGEFTQRQLGIKMNPAVYLAALLIDEGYAGPSSRRGYIQIS